MSQLRTFPLLLGAIVIASLVYRLIGAWHGNLIFDESAHLALAQTISFDPERFHLVFRTLDHPLLSLYVLKLSSLLFGESTFGLRILHVLFGTATVAAVSVLARQVYSERAGLWAAALLAVNQFHFSWSRLFMPEVVMLFFWTLSLSELLRAVERRQTRAFALLGLWMGLAYLAKETGVLLLPVAWLFVLLSREHRSLLSNWRWYLAHGVFVLVVAPDLAWNLAHFSESYLHRDAQLLSEGVRVQFKAFSLYLGELFRWLIDPNVLDVDYDEGNAYVCHWPAGLLLLFATITVPRWGRAPERLLLLSFLFVFGFFTFLPGGGRFDPFWWASATLIPAVVFAGELLKRICRRGIAWQAVAIVLMVYLSLRLIPVGIRPGGPDGEGYPRRSVEEFAAIAVHDARIALTRDDPEFARSRLIYALNIGGPSAAAYSYLGYSDWLQNDRASAIRNLKRSLELDPDNNPTRRFLEQLQAGRAHSGQGED